MVLLDLEITDNGQKFVSLNTQFFSADQFWIFVVNLWQNNGLPRINRLFTVRYSKVQQFFCQKN